MSKWKCGICNSEFENYHAQGFDDIIYCPLCYYKELHKRDKKEIDRLNNIINELEEYTTENIEVLENRLNSPFCNFEKVTKELLIFQNYLDKLKELKEYNK